MSFILNILATVAGPLLSSMENLLASALVGIVVLALRLRLLISRLQRA